MWILALLMGYCLRLLWLSTACQEVITKPLDKLGLAVNEVEQGNLDANFNIHGTIEVEALGTSLSSMITQSSSFWSRSWKIQEKIRSSELKALQSQINPHFFV